MQKTESMKRWTKAADCALVTAVVHFVPSLVPEYWRIDRHRSWPKPAKIPPKPASFGVARRPARKKYVYRPEDALTPSCPQADKLSFTFKSNC